MWFYTLNIVTYSVIISRLCIILVAICMVEYITMKGLQAFQLLSSFVFHHWPNFKLTPPLPRPEKAFEI